MASESVRQHLYLIQELEASVLTIGASLAELQASDPYRPRHFVFLLLLATGIERLLKIILHLRELDASGDFLPPADLKKKYHHRLRKLLDDVDARCFTSDYLTRPIAGVALAFIRNDPMLISILSILADFAGNDRYIYMNGISDPKTVSDTPPHDGVRSKPRRCQQDTMSTCMHRAENMKRRRNPIASGS